MKKALFCLIMLVNAPLFSQDLSGGWTGTLKVQGMELPLVFNFVKTADRYTATMDSPKQGAKDIPCSEVQFTDNKLVIKVKTLALEYVGELKNDTEIVGTFKQSNFSTAMNLTKGVEKMVRPQEPRPPFPYYSEEVQFTNVSENFALAGTLTLPQKEGKFPAVVLISGSGQQNRDSELFGHKSFWVIADYLTRNGIAVLRYDDRGVGQSKGSLMHSTSADFATDAAAAVAYLRTRSEINPKEIGIIGHSEGGMIAPMLAAKDKKIAFLILLAGTGIPGDALLLNQNYEIGKQRGMTNEQLEQAKVSNQKIYAILKSNTDIEATKKQLKSHFESEYKTMAENERPSATELQEQVNSMVSPWLQFFMKHNPQEDLKKVKCPVLVLNGEKDLQVTPSLNTQGIENALKAGGNKNIQVEILPGLNHLFQRCKTCTLEEYGQLEETFAPEVLHLMTRWIAMQTK